MLNNSAVKCNSHCRKFVTRLKKTLFNLRLWRHIVIVLDTLNLARQEKTTTYVLLPKMGPLSLFQEREVFVLFFLLFICHIYSYNFISNIITLWLWALHSQSTDDPLIIPSVGGPQCLMTQKAVQEKHAVFVLEALDNVPPNALPLSLDLWCDRILFVFIAFRTEAFVCCHQRGQWAFWNLDARSAITAVVLAPLRCPQNKMKRVHHQSCCIMTVTE